MMGSARRALKNFWRTCERGKVRLDSSVEATARQQRTDEPRATCKAVRSVTFVVSRRTPAALRKTSLSCTSPESARRFSRKASVGELTFETRNLPPWLLRSIERTARASDLLLSNTDRTRRSESSSVTPSGQPNSLGTGEVQLLCTQQSRTALLTPFWPSHSNLWIPASKRGAS